MNIDKKSIITSICSFILFACLYTSIAHLLDWGNDIRDHAYMAREMLLGERSILGSTFVLYGLSILLSFFSENVDRIMTTICIILAAATTFKLFIATKEIKRIKLSENTNTNYWLSLGIGLSLMIVFTLPVFYFSHGLFYAGYFVPNVWHNSTTILLMPFAILLFLTSCKQIKEYNSRLDILLTILITINIFTKPSFLFVFICAYPLIMLFRYHFSKIFFRSLIPIIIGGIFIILQYWLIYQFSSQDLSEAQTSKIAIGFFEVYKLNISINLLPISLIASYFFPIAYSISNWRKLKNNIIYLFVLLLVIISIAIYAIIFETGPRFTHGNFYWQIVPCSWILYFIITAYLARDIKEEKFSTKNKVLTAIYIIQVLCGVLYLARILFKQFYL